MTKGATTPERKRSIVMTVIILLVVFGAGAGIMNAILSDKQAEDGASTTAGSFNLQPPGPVPEGKEWSVEHGHWHDIATGQASAPANASANAPVVNSSARTPGPQPDGPVPEGKEWNEEHGHWHNKLSASPKTVILPAGEEDAEAVVEEVEESIVVEQPDEDEGPTDFEDVVDEAPVAE